MAYAQISDLIALGGAPAKALLSVDTGTQQRALNAASAVVDTKIRARYSLPLITWDDAITEATCRIAMYKLLLWRGYANASGADTNIRQGYDDAMMFLTEVQKQQAHPLVTAQPNDTPDYQQPFTISSSVVDISNGGTAPNRGW